MLDIFGHELTMQQVIEIMRAHQIERGNDVIPVTEMKNGCGKDKGYWILHDGADYQIVEITNPYAHTETAYAVMQYLGVKYTYESFFTQGVTRVFTTTNELSIRCGKKYKDDVFYICAMTPQDEFQNFSIGFYEFDGERHTSEMAKFYSRDDIMQMF